MYILIALVIISIIMQFVLRGKQTQQTDITPKIDQFAAHVRLHLQENQVCIKTHVINEAH